MYVIFYKIPDNIEKVCYHIPMLMERGNGKDGECKQIYFFI